MAGRTICLPQIRNVCLTPADITCAGVQGGFVVPWSSHSSWFLVGSCHCPCNKHSHFSKSANSDKKIFLEQFLFSSCPALSSVHTGTLHGMTVCWQVALLMGRGGWWGGVGWCARVSVCSQALPKRRLCCWVAGARSALLRECDLLSCTLAAEEAPRQRRAAGATAVIRIVQAAQL